MERFATKTKLKGRTKFESTSNSRGKIKKASLISFVLFAYFIIPNSWMYIALSSTDNEIKFDKKMLSSWC